MFAVSCSVPEVPLRRLQKHHHDDSRRRSFITERSESFKGPSRSLPREEAVPEGWGRLSLVCPQDNAGAPVNRRIRAGRHRTPEKTLSLPLPPLGPCPPLATSGSLDGARALGVMSAVGGGGGGGTLRRFKVTTSKLIGTSSVKRPPSSHMPSALGEFFLSLSAGLTKPPAGLALLWGLGLK